MNIKFLNIKTRIMKRTFFMTNSRKFITAAFLSASMLFTAYAGNAATSKNNIEILSGETTAIQYNGSTTDALLFRVSVNNDKGQRFFLTIKNSDGDVLFSRSFNDVKFNKSFKLLKGENDSNSYYFTVTSEDKSLEDTYVINTAARTVQDVTINKL
jgi:hypothetical protein